MHPSAFITIQNNYHQVLERIAQAARTAGRSPDAVRLVVVTKGHSIDTVRAVLEAGANLLGENYAEEGVEKILASSGEFRVQWHMIGHVQSRKAQLVSRHFDALHSLDSLKLAGRLDRFCAEAGRKLPVLLECNVSGEESKFGFSAWDEAGEAALLAEIEQILALPNLQVRGLMTMAPFLDDPQSARPYFRRLRLLRDRLASRFPQADWSELSMGMSGDFEAAIQEDATLLRIGTAIVGPRAI